MRPDVDVVILGGGCSGLSLAVALAEHVPRLSVLILEGRTSYGRDRTWCFWNTTKHPFEDCVSYQWPAWRVRSSEGEALRKSSNYCYQHIAADTFYRFAQQRIAQAPNQQLALGTPAEDVSLAHGLWAVLSSRGVVRSRWLFDARPPQPTASSSHVSLASARPLACRGLIQRFTGWHVRTETPCFDPATVELMDFRSTRDSACVPGRAFFFYTLPFSPCEALVEATWFDDPRLPAADAETALNKRLAGIAGAGRYQIIFREQGALPMQVASPEPADSGYRIGIAGGRVKASSGYAFLRIQRQSRAIAQALAASAPLPRRIEPPYYAAFDRIFLMALEQHPERASAYLLRLFQRVPTDRLVRFLSEEGSLLEALQVALSLPAPPFLYASAQALGRVATPLPLRTLIKSPMEMR